MLKKTITYIDHDGTERTITYIDHNGTEGTKAELLEMELGTAGGLAKSIENIIAAIEKERRYAIPYLI